MFTRPFLAVQTSFWPLLLSLSLFSLTSNIVIWFRFKITLARVLFSIFIVASISFLWWKDFSRESIIGYHTHKLEFRLRIRILFFILSEVCFFFSFFWAFYDAAIAPTVDIGIMWPPKGILPLTVYSVPLLNTVILLTRGITVTWAHHALINNFYNKSLIRLIVTVLLGAYFIVIQWVEYNEAAFAIADGVYGSTFFIATGFHGMHVTLGALFLLYVFINLLQGKLLYNHHFRFEAAAWYWHFVDVVWLFLFLSVYWWGSL